MITLTGIDEYTDLDELRALYSDDVEFAVLYSADPQAARKKRGDCRYPNHEIIWNHVTSLEGIAVHICGSEAKKQLLEGELDSLLFYAGRIQINGEYSEEELKDILFRYRDHFIVTQFPKVPFKTNQPNHMCLVDGSGGNGVKPSSWKNDTGWVAHVGFAGGLGPSNLAKELPKILKVAPSYWWVDMESSLRTNRGSSMVFNTLKAGQAISIYRRCLEQIALNNAVVAGNGNIKHDSKYKMPYRRLWLKDLT